MSPNIENKFDIKRDTIDDIIIQLRQLVFDQNKSISYSFVSKQFGVHVHNAVKILDQFSTEEKNKGNQLSVNYLLSGNNNKTDDEIKLERLMIVNETDIEGAKTWFETDYNQHIYSVSAVGSEQDTQHSVELNFDELETDIKDKSDLEKAQKLTYRLNPNIELRVNNRRRSIKPVVQEFGKSDKQKVKNENKPKTNTKRKNNKKNKISNMFPKTNKEVKREVEEESNQNNDDPFRSDSEEDVKEVKEEINDEVNEENIDINDDIESEVKDKDIVDDEEVLKSKTNTKRGKKRSSDKRSDSEEEDDEEIFKTNKKSNKKKYRRVRYISDSDSEDEQKESFLDKFVVNKKENSIPAKKLQNVKETHVDEDGYVVTKTVKKEVEVEKKCKAKPEQSLEKNNKKDSNDKKEIVKQKANKKADKQSEAKAKPSIVSKNKTQSSITSFFKPRQTS